MEDKDSNQDLTSKQVLINYTLKLGAPHKKYHTKKQNKTKAEEVGCDYNNLERARSFNGAAQLPVKLCGNQEKPNISCVCV